MNPTAPDPQASERMQNPLSVMSPGEKVLCEIDRHPFGLIGIYLVTGLVIIMVLVGAILAPHYVADMTASTKSAVFAVALIVCVVALLYLWVATMIYKGNKWFVTSDSITQISQVGLFRKQTSQLSLANLEDVTFEQNSMVQTMFGFGTLRVETAGERSKFAFPFCPKPAQYAREIIQAHEGFIQAHPEEGETASPGTYNYAQAGAAIPGSQQPMPPQGQPYQGQQQPMQPYAPAPPTQAPPNDPTQQG